MRVYGFPEMTRVISPNCCWLPHGTMKLAVGICYWANLSVAKVGMDMREVPESKVIMHPSALSLQTPVDCPFVGEGIWLS